MKEVESASVNHFQNTVHIRNPTSVPEVRNHMGFNSLVVQYMSRDD